MRVKGLLLAAGAVLVAAGATAPVRAHHAFAAEFDSNKFWQQQGNRY